MWLDDLDANAMAQARNLANLPFAFKHVAIMPDAHLGYGMPIGGVLATEGVVIPNAVGVDIGCGMCAMKTDIQPDVARTKKALGLIRQRIPVGFKRHKEKQDPALLPEPKNDLPIIEQNMDTALKSLGTLGGGNHFIELQSDEDGWLWVMIHSGSRNLGKQVADAYNKAAVLANAQWHSAVPKEHDLAFLPLGTRVADDYLEEMDYCVRYALANRQLMMERVGECLAGAFGSFVQTNHVNIAHNYARMEHHFGQNVMVHRKGATSAKLGEAGIIPGSQGTASYIVRGLGNPQSFKSCSHGAGRVMGRKQAQRELSLEDQQAILDDQGILHGIRGKGDLDEAPGAYKDIDVVMENQKDLVEIVTKLRPLAVVKG
jgi:tRNA-splicing ligase RtcB